MNNHFCFLLVSQLCIFVYFGKTWHGKSWAAGTAGGGLAHLLNPRGHVRKRDVHGKVPAKLGKTRQITLERHKWTTNADVCSRDTMTSFPAEWGVPSPGWRWRRVLPGPKHPAASLSHSQSHWLALTDWKLRSGDGNSRDKKMGKVNVCLMRIYKIVSSAVAVSLPEISASFGNNLE